MINHYWKDGSNLRIVQVDAIGNTVNEQDVFIPMVEIYERNELEDIVLSCVEDAERDFKVPKKNKLTKLQQHDLGGTLLEIRASKQRKREVGHGKWWAGVN